MVNILYSKVKNDFQMNFQTSLWTPGKAVSIISLKASCVSLNLPNL